MLEKFYRISARDPIEQLTSMTDLKIWSDLQTTLAVLEYWEFCGGFQSGQRLLYPIPAECATTLARKLFGFEFHFCEVRGLCYQGVAARECPFCLYGLVKKDGTCFTAYERFDTDKDKPFFVWRFEGERIAPLPEGDGWIVKPTNILDKEPAKDFYVDMSCYDYKDHLWYQQRSSYRVLSAMEKRYSSIWVNRESPQYNTFVENREYWEQAEKGIKL